jgi:hypothetical protein
VDVGIPQIDKRAALKVRSRHVHDDLGSLIALDGDAAVTDGRDQPESSFEKLGDSPEALNALTGDEIRDAIRGPEIVAELEVVVMGVGR